jgi:hypothetical protein
MADAELDAESARRRGACASATLTMDTYGHLVPGQEAEALALSPCMVPDTAAEAQVLRASGTDAVTPLPEPREGAEPWALLWELIVRHGGQNGASGRTSQAEAAPANHARPTCVSSGNTTSNARFDSDSPLVDNPSAATGRFRSGQTGQTVNLLA